MEYIRNTSLKQSPYGGGRNRPLPHQNAVAPCKILHELSPVICCSLLVASLGGYPKIRCTGFIRKTRMMKNPSRLIFSFPTRVSKVTTAHACIYYHRWVCFGLAWNSGIYRKRCLHSSHSQCFWHDYSDLRTACIFAPRLASALAACGCRSIRSRVYRYFRAKRQGISRIAHWRRDGSSNHGTCDATCLCPDLSPVFCGVLPLLPPSTNDEKILTTTQNCKL